jgi:hypothetical protein
MLKSLPTANCVNNFFEMSSKAVEELIKQSQAFFDSPAILAQKR